MAFHLPLGSPSLASTTSGLTDSSDTNFSSPARHNTVHLRPQIAPPNHPYSASTGLDDPRSSSTQSLRPVESAGWNRRTLLLVYIHGFMGDVTSFKSFPAHVHSILTITLAESHVVYTKIYPRYQSRKNISFARDAFGNWLTPHESEQTDVVLIGHSLGGILGAEVVLIPSHTPGSRDAYQHRILGLIAFDTPFLGMHPGVVSTGIASLFRGAPDNPGTPVESSPQYSGSSASFDTTSSDPNYNPSYENDVNLPVRKNKWDRAWYFWNKHYGELRKATQSYVKSHLEFGGCLADYPGLRKRYNAIRSLEDVDDLNKTSDPSGNFVRRVRFVNYYTASSGRIKEEKPQPVAGHLTTETQMQTLNPSSTDTVSASLSKASTPRLSLAENHDDELTDKMDELLVDDTVDQQVMKSLEPQPFETGQDSEGEASTTTPHIVVDDLPPIPPEPVQPAVFDAAQFTDPDALKLAQKANARQMKAYERARKDREKATSDRERVIAKRERQDRKAQEQVERSIEQAEHRRQQEHQKRQTTLNPEDQDGQIRRELQQNIHETKKKDRKFCSLPGKDGTGIRDKTWIRVYMDGMDEVVAHTSLFDLGETYAKLVGDTAERIEEWIKEDASTRSIIADQGF